MHLMGMSGDSMEGMPGNVDRALLPLCGCPTTKGDPFPVCPAAYAIGYVAEGGLTGQYSSEKFPLTAALKEKGLTEEKWDAICKSLAAGKGFVGMDGGFSKAIAKANEDFLDKIGCIGAYAEYGKGQKCMVVLTKEAATPDVVTMP